MIKYREANRFDIPVLVALDREYFPHTAWAVEQFKAEIGVPSRCFLIAEMEGEVIGYAGAFLPTIGGEGDIMTIAIMPEYRRQGIATHFISELEKWAKGRGAEAMMLEVDITNNEAISLYLKFGYEKLNIRKNYYGYGIDAQIMKRRI